jgi:uncharacterized coiled-coil DUF342 family protein
MTEYTLQEQLRSADCRGCEHMSDRAADTIDALQAEVADCHANINTKADFINATINQLAAADERADDLRDEAARLRLALEWYGEQVHTFSTEQAGKRWGVTLDLDGGSHARAALRNTKGGETDQ